MKKILVITMLTTGLFLYQVNGMAEEKSVTPQEFVTTVAEVPSKISNHIQAEWQETKYFQKAAWEDSKDQFARTKNAITDFFSKFSSGN